LLETHEITGFEALVRWQHPRQGVISPTEFIPLAEETGLIKRLGTWVLREACRQLHSWQQQSRPFLTMSVNLSSIQLSQPDLVEQVQEILQESGVAYGSLRLEITESAIIENQATAIATLRQLKALGIQLYMDDFGTGYSSLSRLHDLPIDVLKIDRSFVCQQKWDIIQAIMILSGSLKLKVIAEGVETPEELENLNRLGCTQAQGYLFSKPLDCQAAWALVK
jgi:EAL domain-containing protein (putative c-di-GMP-specific phosphodiesterase class I)